MTATAKGKPRIAVVLPVYNGEKYLAAAMRSVLAQTFRDFEIVVVDDGSTDRTAEILAGFSDARLRLIRQSQNLGLVAALNTGIRESQSEFIARMDADDICHPRRFEKQVAYLETHPDVSVCGTWYRTFGARRRSVRVPVEPEHIRARLFFGWAMGHPTIMMRRSFLEQHGLVYNDEFRHVEDLDFLSRAAELTRLANLPEFLLLNRAHDCQVSVVYEQDQLETEGRLAMRHLRLLLPGVTSEEAAFHRDLAKGLLPPSRLAQAEDWLLRLDRENLEKGTYDARHFRQGLCKWWHRAHSTQAASGGIGVLLSYWKSPLASIRGIGFYKHAALAVQSVIRRPPPSWWKPCRRFVERLRASMFRTIT